MALEWPVIAGIVAAVVAVTTALGASLRAIFTDNKRLTILEQKLTDHTEQDAANFRRIEKQIDKNMSLIIDAIKDRKK